MKQPFTGTGEYVARKVFTYQGKTYKAGDVFPWEKLGINQRRLRQMFDCGHIEGKAQKSSSVPQAKKEKQKKSAE